MLRPEQIRRLAFMGFLFLIAVSLLFLYPQFRSLRDRVFGPKAVAPTPAPREAPAPPPSPYPPGTVLLHGALKDVQDLTDLASLETDHAYRQLVDHAASLPADALRGMVEGRIPYATYLKYAPELRGRAFRLRGIASAEVELVRLPTPVAGIADVYRVWLMDLDDDAGFICDLVEKPPHYERKDWIEVEGLFLKVLRYVSRQNQAVEVPLLVGRTLRLAPPPADAESDGKLFVFKLVICLGIMAVLVVAFFVNKSLGRRQAGLRLRRAARRPGEGPPASPPP